MSLSISSPAYAGSRFRDDYGAGAVLSHQQVFCPIAENRTCPWANSATDTCSWGLCHAK